MDVKPIPELAAALGAVALHPHRCICPTHSPFSFSTRPVTRLAPIVKRSVTLVQERAGGKRKEMGIRATICRWATKGATGSQCPLLKRADVTAETVGTRSIVDTVCEVRARNAVSRAYEAGARHSHRDGPHVHGGRQETKVNAFVKIHQLSLH